MDNPKLTEYSTKKFVFDKLQQCHTNRVTIYYYILNIGVFLLFILIVYLALTSCYKNKMTIAEKKYKMMKEQDFILSRIRYFQEENKKNQDSQYSDITNLPYT